MEFKIHVKGLKAVALFTAKQDVRFYLHDVHVEVHPDRTLLVATDGHCLAVHSYPCSNDIESSFDFQIPFAVVEQIMKSKVTEIVLKHNPDGSVEYAASGATQTFMPLQNKFPTWRRVVPMSENLTGELAQYNPDYLAKAQKAFRQLDPKIGGKTDFISLKHNGASGGLVYSPRVSNFVVVVMPLRDKTTGENLTDFVYETQAPGVNIGAFKDEILA